MALENKIERLNDYFIGTVLEININSREVAAFIPRLMPAIAGGKSYSATIVTSTNPKISGLDYTPTLRIRNSIWLQPWDYKEPMPKVGSKIAVYFLDGNPKLGYWILFNPNNNYEVIDEEKYKNIFRLNISGRNISVLEEDTVSINFPESFNLVYNENQKTKTFSLTQKENYVISIDRPINPFQGLIWYNPEINEIRLFTDGEFKKFILEDEYALLQTEAATLRTYLETYIEGDRWYDITNEVLYTYTSGDWNAGEAVPSTIPFTPVTGDKWFDVPNRYLYTYGVSDWDQGFYVPVKAPLGGN